MLPTLPDIDAKARPRGRGRTWCSAPSTAASNSRGGPARASWGSGGVVARDHDIHAPNRARGVNGRPQVCRSSGPGCKDARLSRAWSAATKSKTDTSAPSRIAAPRGALPLRCPRQEKGRGCQCRRHEPSPSPWRTSSRQRRSFQRRPPPSSDPRPWSCPSVGRVEASRGGPSSTPSMRTSMSRARRPPGERCGGSMRTCAHVRARVGWPGRSMHSSWSPVGCMVVVGTLTSRSAWSTPTATRWRGTKDRSCAVVPGSASSASWPTTP